MVSRGAEPMPPRLWHGFLCLSMFWLNSVIINIQSANTGKPEHVLYISTLLVRARSLYGSGISAHCGRFGLPMFLLTLFSPHIQGSMRRCGRDRLWSWPRYHDFLACFSIVGFFAIFWFPFAILWNCQWVGEPMSSTLGIIRSAMSPCKKSLQPCMACNNCWSGGDTWRISLRLQWDRRG